MTYIVYDDGPLTMKEKRGVVARIGKRLGWDDPEMDVYDELDPRKTT